MLCRQSEVVEQQAAEAAQASRQQKQSHQQTVALLDQCHMDQLTKLQQQALTQAAAASAAEAKLKAQLAEQTDLAQQLQQRLSELERQHEALQRKSVEDQAVVKMLLKQRADSAAESAPVIESGGASSKNMKVCESKGSLATDTRAASQSLSPRDGVNPHRTLVLEADVLRKEATVLTNQLAQAEASVLKLTQARREDELQSAAKLSELEGTLKELEGKHLGSAAVLDQTMAAMQRRTARLLQQRQSGGTQLPASARVISLH